jgi:hypothetical protein
MYKLYYAPGAASFPPRRKVHEREELTDSIDLAEAG